jgi:hypothetical protein
MSSNSRIESKILKSHLYKIAEQKNLMQVYLRDLLIQATQDLLGMCAQLLDCDHYAASSGAAKEQICTQTDLT